MLLLLETNGLVMLVLDDVVVVLLVFAVVALVPLAFDVVDVEDLVVEVGLAVEEETTVLGVMKRFPCMGDLYIILQFSPRLCLKLRGALPPTVHSMAVDPARETISIRPR